MTIEDAPPMDDVDRSAEYRHTAESLVRSVQAIDHIANVLVATAQGPAELCRSVVTAAAEHVGAQSTVLALRPTRLPNAAIREVFLGTSGVVHTDLQHASRGVRLRVSTALKATTTASPISRAGRWSFR